MIGVFWYNENMKVLKVFFISLGVIFFILIIVAAYIWIADPFNLKPLLSAGASLALVFKAVTGGGVAVDNVDKIRF